MKDYPVHTSTFDNCKEFVDDAIALALDADICFGHSYFSRERWTFKNINKLIRHCISEDADFSELTIADIQFVENR